MGIDRETLARAVEELQPLCGGRIQRVDLVADHELVFELRFPGRSIRILISARAGSGRVHAIADRPAREIAGGDLQRALRKRIEGRLMLALGLTGRTVEIDLRDARILIRIDGGKDAIQILPPADPAVPLPELRPIPDRFPISEAIAARFAAAGPEGAAERLRVSLLASVRARRKKLEKLRANLTRDEARLRELAASRRHGELLKTMLGQVPRGASVVHARDWETGDEVAIPLDPALGPKGNMERLFQRARKADRGRPVVADRLAKAERELAALAAAEAEVAAADAARLLQLSEGDLGGPRRAIAGLEAPRAQPEKKDPIDRWSRRFAAADGTEIRVGKGAKENDRLTLQGANADDWWLHASGTSGAHVVLRVQKGKEPSPESLLDAATLAAHYSSAATSAKVEVVYTEARYVKKRKGDPPGRVSVARARTLYVTVDPKRLDRLFGRA